MDYNEVIRLVNNKIENSEFERFNEQQVIDELNNCLRDIANKTKVFQSMEYVPLSKEQWSRLPKQYVEINRIMFRGKKLPTLSQEKMDDTYFGWENRTTDCNRIINIVYNNFDRHKITLYPKVNEIAVLTDDELKELEYVGQLEREIPTYVFKDNNHKVFISTGTSIPTNISLVECITVYGSFLPERLVKSDTVNNLSMTVLLDEAYINTLIYGTAGYLLLQPGRTEDLGRAQQFLKVYGIDETEIGSIRTDLFSNSKQTQRDGEFLSPFRS